MRFIYGSNNNYYFSASLMPIGLFMVNPILIINLGAEMVYIIDQRLNAQQISHDKSVIVLSDLVTTLFSHSFQPTLFKPARTYSQNFTRKLFDQIAHCSIMKLNETSMSKLYDLMTMTFKRQVLLSTNPHEIYHISIQHFEGVSRLLKNDVTSNCLSSCKETFIKMYQKLNAYDYYLIRSELLKYLQSKYVRVQMFLTNGWQNNDGQFTLANDRIGGIGVKTPGDIIIFDAEGSIKSRQVSALKSSRNFIENLNKYFFEGMQTDLARNLYAPQQDEANQDLRVKKIGFQQQTLSKGYTEADNDHAKQELNSLASMIKGKKMNDEQMQEYYSVSVLRSNQNQQQGQIIDEKLDEMVLIQQSQSNRSILTKQNIEKLFSELTVDNQSMIQNEKEQEEEEEEDLLAMMDKASFK